MDSNEIAVLNGVESAELCINRNPDTVLAEAGLVSKALAKYAERHQLYKTIGTSKHLMIEGWQMCASMYRVTTRTVETRFMDLGNGVHGFEAIAEAVYVPTGAVLGRADAMCLNDEDNWGLRPKYEYQNNVRVQVGNVAVPLQQLRSMAQTRAQSKVLASLFKWVAKIGGFSGTPAEEMTGNEDTGRPAPPSPQRRSEGSGGGNTITEPQQKRLYAISKGAGKTEEEVKDILHHFGFQSSKEITRDKYEAICAEVEKRDAVE